MNRSLLICLMITFSLFASAKGEKVVDRSHKKTPEWVNSMQSGYIIATVAGRSIDEARNGAMEQVKQQIITSIALHIEGETSRSISQYETNDRIEAEVQFKQEIRTRTANIPFIHNISEVYVVDYYWEKVEVAKGKFDYHYSIKYPFSAEQLQIIISEYKDKELKIQRKLDEFSSVDFSTLESVEDMMAAIGEINGYIVTIPKEDEHHIKRCRAIKDKYNQMLSNLHIKFENVNRNSAIVKIFYGDHKIVCLMTPKIRSNCISEIQYVPQQDGGLIKYNYEAGCYDDESNELSVTFIVAGKKVSSTCYVY